MSGPTYEEQSAASCSCQAEDIILLPCSGASNCGQLANEAAVTLDVTGKGRFYCLAGLGAHIEGMVNSAGGAKKIVAIDGCPVACAKKTVEQAGLTVTDWLCVTEQGVAKNHNLLLEQEDIELVTDRVRDMVESILAG